MALRPMNGHNLQNYPKIQIDRGSVIKPCTVNQVAADPFIDNSVSSWRKVFHDVWHEGIPFILKCISNLKVPENSNLYYTYLIKAIKYIALLMIHIHTVYLYIYGYFYPYSLMTLDDVCNEFSKCPKWTESVIRAFAWHPNHDRCALAVCNDYVYVYHGPTRIKVLRHNHQHKIMDLAWQPNNKDILVVATQTNIVIWKVTDNREQLISLQNGARISNLTYFTPNLQLTAKNEDTSKSYRSLKHDMSSNIAVNNNLPSQASSGHNFRIIDFILPPPIVSIVFNQSGNTLLACSPNSSKIAVIDVSNPFSTDCSDSDMNRPETGRNVTYIRRFGQGVTRLLMSPEKNRLATATTSSFFRVFEPFTWSCNLWKTNESVVQDMVWSQPAGRMLLIANKLEPYVYALPFLDSPQAKDVGGNKSMMMALDLTATKTEFGDIVGGRVQSFAWDRNGKRLAISFKDNPESILLYRTAEQPTVEFHQLGVIKSENGSTPLLMQFHDKFKSGSLLTICWSDGNCQHIPLTYSPLGQARGNFAHDDKPNGSFNHSTNSFSETNSSPKTPRSLTNFCHVSGNNSISSYPSSLMPINKVQHQTTLYSLSTKSPLTENNSPRTKDD